MILVRDDIPYSRVGNQYRPPTPDHSSYVAASRIFTPDKSPILLIDVYSPPARWSAGQGTQEQTFQPEGLPAGPGTIIAGDLNAHAHVWDPHQPEDALGRHIEDWMLDTTLTCLNDGAPTRLNPATGGRSAPDVTLVSADLAGGATWKTDPDIGSDHLPINHRDSTGQTKEKRARPPRHEEGEMGGVQPRGG